MPDLLAHALVAYGLATLLSWRYEWLSPAYVTVAMAGAFVPDLTKVSLLVPNSTVQSVLDVPFSWFALHTLGGSLVSLAIGVVLVARPERERVAALLGLGVASHLLADALLLNPSGRSYPLLWPLSYYHPPTPGLYLSTDPEPMLVAAAVAGGVFLATRVRQGRDDT
jgi:membrane-bound metal-dependent hydrolase YbcI (DUF457 family)